MGEGHAHAATGGVDTGAGQDAVGPGDADVLERTQRSPLRGGNLDAADAVVVDDEYARFDPADDASADDVERWVSEARTQPPLSSRPRNSGRHPEPGLGRVTVWWPRR
jgi:hypothetical protein